MAKHQQLLETNIVLNGHVDNEFYQLGEALTVLGSQINAISQKLIDFGKESIDVYRKYEDGILETRSVLQTQYTNTNELNKAMQSLEEHTQQWAATTIFHTDDVANAMATAAHAGWEYDQIIQGLPSAMLIAQAGGMELSQSVDYLAKMLASTNTDFKDSERFIDEWARAADLVATDIPELGNAFIRLGSSAQFAKNNEELLTMLAVLANVGTVGETAGTGLRNMMMRLLAPTAKATEAMYDLGISEDEIAEAFAGVDENSYAAYQRLEQYGFSAYDAQGNLRSFIDIFTDLNFALEQIPTEQEQNELLASIFPTRTLAYAKAMLNAAKDGSLTSIYNTIYGDSEGYAQNKSDILMSGLSGSLEILDSKWEEYHRKVGESLAPEVERIADGLGDIIDDINGIDDSTLDALVSGASVIAAAGPGIMLAGGAFRLIGSLLTPTGAMVMGATALAAAIVTIEKLHEADMISKFGNMAMDSEALSKYIRKLGADFKTTYTEVDTFNDALEQSVADYTTASSTFSSDLLTAMLTQTTLTDAEKEKLQNLGNEMYAAVLNGVANSTSSSMAYLNMLFGGDSVAENDPAYRELINITSQNYENTVGMLEGYSQGLRDALNSAFEDGQISAEERANIMSYVQSMNEALAEAAALEEEAETNAQMALWLHKAQSAGLEGVNAIAKEVVAERDSKIAGAEEEHIKQRSEQETYGGKAIEEGWLDTEGNPYTEQKLQDALAEVDKRYEAKIEGFSAGYDSFLLELYESTIKDSELGTAYGDLEELLDAVMSGAIQSDTAVQLFADSYGRNRNIGEGTIFDGNTVRTQLSKYITSIFNSFGGEENIREKIAYYETLGDSENAMRFRRLYAMQQIIDDYAVSNSGIFGYGIGDKENYESVMQGHIAGYNLEAAREGASLLGYDALLKSALFHPNEEDDKRLFYEMEDKDSELNRLYDSLNSIYDFDKIIQDVQAEYAHEETAADLDMGLTNFTQDNLYGNLAALYSLLYGSASRNPDAYKRPLAINVTDNGSAENTRSEIESTFASPITQDIDVRFTGRTGGGVLNTTVSKYADGGRADEPSIFGEAGAEWAIPEAHTQRTAALLDAARAASGFTWPELLSRSGGLNAGSGGTGTLVYSPTIIANDASGVEQKLIEDKARLERWMRERSLREEVEVYA